VTTFRSSRAAGASPSAAPQALQNRDPGGFSAPHAGQAVTRSAYDARRRCEAWPRLQRFRVAVIFEPEFEAMPRDALRELQGERLRDLVRYVHERVPFYRNRLADAGVAPGDVRGVDDLAKLPFTHKIDLRDAYPFGLFAVPRAQCVRVHASSGTTGKPIVGGYTREDVDLFARVNARALAMAGGEPGMMLHNAYGYGLFTGGLGLHYGGERLGMTVVPVSGGMTERQLLLIEDFRPDLITCTPSYALTLAHELARRGVSPDEVPLRFACVGAEPWTEGMREEIDAGLGIRATNIYGLTEIIGPGVSNECVEARDGSHVMEDHFLPEVVDAETGEPLPEGEEGVLVFTTLTKQAMPLLRYWTGDITTLRSGECACGRTLVRMGLLRGRTDDMLIVRGVNVYPTQVESVLVRIPELTPHYRIVVTREATLDEAEVQVERRASARPDGLAERVEALLRETIGVGMRVRLLEPGDGPRSEGGKLPRVEDRRRL
jgi:phenylacetate-CoA ligase